MACPGPANSEVWQEALLARDRPRIVAFAAGLRHAVGPGAVCGVHSHPAIEIVYHPTGRGRTLLAGRPLEFAENSVVVYAPGEPHDQAMSAEGEDWCVQLAAPKSLCARLHRGFYLADLRAGWISEEIRHLSRWVAPAGGKVERGVLDLRATSVLLGLVDACEAGSRRVAAQPGERHVHQAERFIQEHFGSIRSLRAVAAHVGISHDHLRHLFKARRGRPLVRYLNDVRITRAKLLLTRSPLPLKQIAAQCGYRDEQYFSSVFRRLAAMPPGVYRQNTAPGRRAAP